MKFFCILLLFVPLSLYGGSYFKYRVESSDTIATISDKFHVDSKSIISINSLKDVNKIYVGQVLEIPVVYSYFRPIKADLQTILGRSTKNWRNPGFELYSWDKVSSVLIFDTLNYSFQALMFKRLAYFVEKKDHSGSIYTIEYLEDKRGWNGHDYKPDDIADFFNKVSAEGFELTKGEEVLKDIVLKNRIVVSTRRGYIGGRGAVISCSRSSQYSLRKSILTHESYHGLFFTSPSFRRYSNLVWSQLDDDSKEVWLLYLDFLDYDITIEKLVVNEFMAYMLQCREKKSYDFFIEIVRQRLLFNYPERKSFLRNYFSKTKKPFEDSIKKLEAFYLKLNVE